MGEHRLWSIKEQSHILRIDKTLNCGVHIKVLISGEAVEINNCIITLFFTILLFCLQPLTLYTE